MRDAFFGCLLAIIVTILVVLFFIYREAKKDAEKIGAASTSGPATVAGPPGPLGLHVVK